VVCGASLNSCTVQCKACLSILEERATDLLEQHAITQLEETHAVITPDFVVNELVNEVRSWPSETGNDSVSPLFDGLFCFAVGRLTQRGLVVGYPG